MQIKLVVVVVVINKGFICKTPILGSLLLENEEYLVLLKTSNGIL